MKHVLTAVLSALSLVLASCSSGERVGAEDPTPARTVSPLAGKSLYSDPQNNAKVMHDGLLAQGRVDVAKAIKPLLSSPSAIWFGGQGNPYPRVDRVMTAATAAGKLPVLVVYNIPGRDCGLYSAGGLPDRDAYLSWVGSFAAALKNRQAIVILEPDAVAHSLSDCTTDESAERHRTLALAVAILKRETSVRLYLDAGNASWIADFGKLSTALQASGIKEADGFALNVSNFETTSTSAAYGQTLSKAVGGKPFVIDVSRNGAGAPPNSADHSSWCNPVSARLGKPPTTNPGLELVDALLWIKHPGDSDGRCRPGAPPAGEWFMELALQLVR